MIAINGPQLICLCVLCLGLGVIIGMAIGAKIRVSWDRWHRMNDEEE